MSLNKLDRRTGTELIQAFTVFSSNLISLNLCNNLLEKLSVEELNGLGNLFSKMSKEQYDGLTSKIQNVIVLKY
ncbi:hypothetical protein [Legionella sp.]|uniref:hypothetical protein n=1 Tax=Legionella sp. TaxID=459 RepID=UPI003C951785